MGKRGGRRVSLVVPYSLVLLRVCLCVSACVYTECVCVFERRRKVVGVGFREGDERRQSE